MKKTFLVLQIIMALWCNIITCSAQEVSGKVILDLKEDSDYEFDENKFWPTVIQKGKDYIDDVKQYNEQLVEESIDRDFKDDLKNKYPEYSDNVLHNWQNYVRKGVKVVRFFDNIKQKIKKWVLDYELPIVVDDDQFESGKKEKYIESETPIVRTDFKKVISYSKSTKDRLATKEKYAKDHNLPLPSQSIKWYRENIVQGNWKKIWNKFLQDIKVRKPNEDADNNQNEPKAILKTVYTMMMKYNGFDDSGKFEGIIEITPPDGKIVLLNDYKQYNGLVLDFSSSENIKDITTHFVTPNTLKVKDGSQIIFYSKTFPIYFQGTVENVNQDAVLKLNGTTDVCIGNSCETDHNHLELTIKHVDELKQSSFAYSVDVAKINTPNEINKNKFKIYGLYEDVRQEIKGIRFEFSTEDNTNSKVIMIGKNAQNFSSPSINLQDNKINAWFKLINKEFDYTDQEFTFWLIQKNNIQYLTTLKIKKSLLFGSDNSKFSLGIVCLALLGGFILNFMPCVFPVLFLKLLAFTKFGGTDKNKTRLNFMYNSLGIGFAFFIIAIVLSLLKKTGMVMGWGMQFQSINFLAFIIWVVTFFMAYILGIVNLGEQKLLQKFCNHKIEQNKIFEFLSGVFLVLLSTPCVAPYLGTALGIALAGSPLEIIITIMAIGLGLALPYILVAIFPQIASYIPHPGRWLKFINGAMIILLIITLIWLLNLLAVQCGLSQLWHWFLYIIAALIIWSFYTFVQKEIDKLEDGEFKRYMRKKHRIGNFVLTILLIIGSFVDVRINYNKQTKQTIACKFSNLDIDKINEYVKSGRTVLVKIEANWCLTCKYNNIFVFDLDYIQETLENNNVIVINEYWNNYDKNTLNFMQRFGRNGLPFYVLFSPKFIDGLVLPEIPNKYEFLKLIR